MSSSVEEISRTAPVYRRKVPLTWWAKRRSYLLFILRELSSVAVAWSVVYLLMLVYAVYRGADRYREFLAWSSQPWVVLINIVALAFLLLHSITFFKLAGQTLVIRVPDRPGVPRRLRRKLVPPRLVGGAHFAAWAFVSLVVAVIVWFTR
jgi:fumarate reductase subunit C